MIPYKPLRLEDYISEEDPQEPNLEEVAGAAYDEAGGVDSEIAQREALEEQESYDYGIATAIESPEIDEIRQALADELKIVNDDSLAAQKKVVE